MAITIKDYPLMDNRKDIIFTPNGKNIDEITFENLENGSFEATDCRISKECLLAQAEIAKQIGNNHMAMNLSRAAELVDLSSERILEIYGALRPYRSTEKELFDIAEELRKKHAAELNARFIEEAAIVLKSRKRLRGDR